MEDTVAAGETDSFDEILKKVVRPQAASSGPPELARGTVFAGRFTIERVVGVGGMGTVYIARDASLGREVAIKVHHAPGGGVRLRREAIAMARLAHPNVVTVFEVGELEQRPFVVMELVTGTTLRDWLRAEPRGVREILDVMIGTGEGLAAAHDAGLVHRDIKPENVLIASDGRPRVGDFGLARELDSKDDPPPAAGSSHDLAPMTQTGAVLGTPAYMAPEQLLGASVDARADQFAFCVTAWEALWNERPFAGATFEQLVAAVTKGVRRQPPPVPKVPARVRAALERGLSTDPAARFGSMQALLAELREPRRRRRIAVALVAGGAALGIAGYFALSRASAPSCGDPGDPVLPRGLPAQVRALGAADAAERIGGTIDAFTAQYRTAKRFGCEALQVQHAWSPELAAKSDACIAEEVAVAQRLLQPAVVTAAKARSLVMQVAMIQGLEHCTDPTYLAAMRPLPADPGKLDALIAARAELRIAFATMDRTPRAQSVATLDALSRSPAHAEPDIAAGIMLVRAGVLALDGKLAESDKLLADAYYAARAVDDPEETLAALSGLIEHSTRLRVDRETEGQWLRIALADAERLRIRSPWFESRVYSMAAHLADDEEDAPRALSYIAAARPLLRGDDADIIALKLIEADIQMWTGKVEEGIAAYEAAIAAEEQRYGADSPHLGISLTNYASSLLAAGRSAKALEIGRRAERIIVASADVDLYSLDGARVNLAAVLLGSNLDDEALPLLETARANEVAAFGEDNKIVANIDANLAVIDGDRGDHAAVIARLLKVLAIEEKQIGPDSLEVAGRHYSIAASLRKLGRHAEALASARKALAIFEVKGPGSSLHLRAKVMVATTASSTHDYATALALTTEALAGPAPVADDLDSQQNFAWAHLERGRALIALHRAAEAKTDLAAAHEAFVALHMPERAAEVEALQLR